MDRIDYVKPENWYGSFYELSIEYSPGGNDDRLLTAIQTMWQSPGLTGAWYRLQDYSTPTQTLRQLPEEGARLYGLIDVSEGKAVGCLSVTVREENGSDWLDLCIPTGMLELAFTVRYPLFMGFAVGKDPPKLDEWGVNPWLEDVDNAFMQIAETVYAAAPFDFAIYGEEVSGWAAANTVTVEQLSQGGYLISPNIFDWLQPNVSARSLPSGLLWVPYQRPV